MRKEIRDLSSNSWDKVVKAMWVLKKTSTKRGKKEFGEAYISYDDLVLRHIQAAMNPAGDSAHFTPHFPIWHRLWLLEFEDSLLRHLQEIH